MDASQVARHRPVLVYDGDCGFCTTCVHLLERIGPDAEIVAWQLTVRSGHEAVAAVLDTAGRIWRIAGRALLLPGISWVAARAYRLIADNRYRLPGGTPACAVTREPRAPAPRP